MLTCTATILSKDIERVNQGLKQLIWQANSLLLMLLNKKSIP